MKFPYTVFLLALAAAGAVGAQQPRRITFNDAIAIALEQNLAVKQAKNAVSIPIFDRGAVAWRTRRRRSNRTTRLDPNRDAQDTRMLRTKRT